jgi:hypothetical protein
MNTKFNYESVGSMYFGAIYRPVAKVAFQSPNSKHWTETWMIIDTGADFSILPRYIAKDLNISLEKDCITDDTVGVGGRRKVYLCKQPILAKIGDTTRKVPLAFFDSDNVPPLLGRCGFLETFDVEFLKEHMVMFKG